MKSAKSTQAAAPATAELTAEPLVPVASSEPESPAAEAEPSAEPSQPVTSSEPELPPAAVHASALGASTEPVGEPAPVRGRALIDLPAHGLACGEHGALPFAIAIGLARAGEFDPRAPEPKA